jgi:hypothetical protein
MLSLKGRTPGMAIRPLSINEKTTIGMVFFCDECPHAKKRGKIADNPLDNHLLTWYTKSNYDNA